ncbi:protein MIZU-KUSSEI 1 [Cucumis melo var. makuwa]|uniref:Protein MIZU-KUSSEI 1 n=2 Tax=Cucumis melo TaxID=3656 RepID=A0A5A7SY53_CUCMM|nr:protein MIZU-KUSSEI 1 [Cucumis melo var. makuwa]TYK15784.1 protein MIZU-KUSSEI 1 [Cucumis melo var. makuwa]
MADPMRRSSSPSPPPPPPPLPSSPPCPGPPISLQPSPKRSGFSKRPTKLLRQIRAVFRTLPILSPACRIPLNGGSRLHDVHVHGGTRITGTIFGYRKSRVNLAFQESPRCLPMLILELAIPTGKLLQDMGVGMVRLALECEKRPSEKRKILDEPIWTLYCNGKKSGYGVRRDPSNEDLKIMQTLNAVSMGAGVIPGEETGEGDQLTYMRVDFERVTGSKDSETFYMINPDTNNGAELSIFLVRI